MKILAINGSPNRTGSTVKLIEMLLEICKDAGADCEVINLEDYNIEGCNKCRKCIIEGECSADDDFIQLKAKMAEAGGIIIGSPYIGGNPTEQIVLLMDRLHLSGTCNKLFDKKNIVGISTSAVDNCKSVAEYCANLGDIGTVGGVIVSGLLFESIVHSDGVKDITENEGIKDRISKTAEKLLSDICKDRVNQKI